MNDPTQNVLVASPVYFYIPVICQDDHGMGPRWAQITMTQDTVDLILKLRHKVVSDDLMQVIKHAPSGLALCSFDNKSASSASLHVTDTQFWYSAVAEFVTGEVTTIPIYIEELLCALKGEREMGERYWRRNEHVLVVPPARRMSFLRELRQCGETLEWFPY